MMTPKKALARRLDLLESHLRSEHASLLPVLPTFRSFDRILYRMGLLDPSESLATRIPWWPMISILGLFSSGKSSFINSYLGVDLQATGNQAVDDRFTVICFGPDRKYDSLPGTALNADPRFPFYRVSDEIEKVAAGEGKRIDAYLQLKTSSSARIRGKIVIDSPGFDADDQRRSTLRVVDHIIDLSDLVLVFFDARRPEPGSMQDTLEHLVSRTVQRPDSRKFLYVLNQIDTSSREDNPEAIVGAWQRAIAQAGLLSGKFYGIYNRDVAPPIDDPAKRARYETKCETDLSEITARINEIEVGRGYRIVGILDTLAKELEGEIVPNLEILRSRWRRRVLTGDAILFGLLVVAAGAALYGAGGESVSAWWDWLMAARPDWFGGLPVRFAGGLAGLGLLLLAIHFTLRASIAKEIAKTLPERFGQLDLNGRAAFLRNTGPTCSLFRRRPVGWGRRTTDQIYTIREAISRHVQRWNDEFTDPNGIRHTAAQQPSGTSWAAPPPPLPAVEDAAGPEPAGPATDVPAATATGGIMTRLKRLAASR